MNNIPNPKTMLDDLRDRFSDPHWEAIEKRLNEYATDLNAQLEAHRVLMRDAAEKLRDLSTRIRMLTSPEDIARDKCPLADACADELFDVSSHV